MKCDELLAVNSNLVMLGHRCFTSVETAPKTSSTFYRESVPYERCSEYIFQTFRQDT